MVKPSTTQPARPCDPRPAMGDPVKLLGSVARMTSDAVTLLEHATRRASEPCVRTVAPEFAEQLEQLRRQAAAVRAAVDDVAEALAAQRAAEGAGPCDRCGQAMQDRVCPFCGHTSGAEL